MAVSSLCLIGPELGGRVKWVCRNCRIAAELAQKISESRFQSALNHLSGLNDCGNSEF
jgi:hypothetical protein